MCGAEDGCVGNLLLDDGGTADLYVAAALLSLVPRRITVPRLCGSLLQVKDDTTVKGDDRHKLQQNDITRIGIN